MEFWSVRHWPAVRLIECARGTPTFASRAQEREGGREGGRETERDTEEEEEDERERKTKTKRELRRSIPTRYRFKED